MHRSPFATWSSLSLLLLVAAAGCAHGGKIGGRGGGGSNGTGGMSASSGPIACSNATDCASLGDACHLGACVGGTCQATAANEGMACTPTDMCTTAATCKAGVCSGSPISCTALNDKCNVGTCDPKQGCVKSPANEGAACDDGKFCTTNDACMNGTCTGTQMMCPAPMNPCEVGQCDETTMGCKVVPGNNGAACPSTDACVKNTTCSSGLCGGGQPVTACTGGDGCCPMGCDATNDSDCANCTTNIALGATPLMSAGGTAAHGPTAMNDGVGPVCTAYAWVTDGPSPNGAYIELDWPAPQAIGSFYIQTDNGQTPLCGVTGRNIASGTVQTWNGSGWVTAGSFSGQHGDVQFNLVPPVKTTKLRVFNMTTDPGNGNSIIFEWHVYTGKSCAPPP